MKNKLIYDIGYNVGNFTRQFLHYYPNSKVIGVDGNEPFLRHFNSNPVEQVTFLNCLVSDKNCDDMDFYVCDSNLDISSVNPKFIEKIRWNSFFQNTKRAVKMKSITLDYMIATYGKPDMIKLDIEGAESIALKGLSHKVDLITMEWCEEYFENTLECVELLKALGYTRFANSEQSDQLQNVVYTSWEELDLFSDIDSQRKIRWGTLYAK